MTILIVGITKLKDFENIAYTHDKPLWNMRLSPTWFYPQFMITLVPKFIFLAKLRIKS